MVPGQKHFTIFYVCSAEIPKLYFFIYLPSQFLSQTMDWWRYRRTESCSLAASIEKQGRREAGTPSSEVRASRSCRLSLETTVLSVAAPSSRISFLINKRLAPDVAL